MAINTNLQGFYKFSDNTDSSGNGITLTNNGGVTFGPGLIGNCAQFGTSNTTKSFSTTSTYSITGDWTVNFWFYTTTTSVVNSPFQLIYGTNRQIDFIYDGANTRLAVWTGNFATTLTPAQAISSSTWYNVSIECSGTTVEIFLNNVSKGTLTNTATSGRTNGFTLGGPNSWYHQGNLDLLYIYNRAIGSTDRTTLYNGGAGYEYGAQTTNPAFLLNFL